MKNKIIILFFSFFFHPLSGWAAHGLSLGESLKYPPGFAGFDYTSAEAKVGGTLTLHADGSYDKMNPFTLKGTAPDLLGELLFETLTIHSLDEPFAQYGLVAQDVESAPDGLSVTYTLHPEARFSNGEPITAADVQFSLETLRSDKAHPSYQSYWRDIRAVEILDPRRVRFIFERKNRELGLIAGDLPLLNRAFYQKNSFDGDELTVPLGSGPYLVENFDPGKYITFKRNPNYWGWKRPVRRGMFNFERIVVKYFKDPQVALEGFKAGEFDFFEVNNSKEWARDYQGPKFDQGRIRKESLTHKNGTGMQGFAFNLRRPLFQDLRVRRAMTLAFDFEWSNQNLFYGQYTRSTSYFSNSELAASGAPAPEEVKMVEPFRDKVPTEFFAPVVAPPTTTPPNSLRDNLRRAAELLKEAGWQVGPDHLLVKGNQKFELELLLVMPAFERILTQYAANLKRLGIQLNYRTVDSSLYQQRLRNFDFDIIVHTFPQSQSPGNEQRDFWHSASADQAGSRNMLGLKDPVVDGLVDKIIYATSRSELETACHALDRVLLAGQYVVPNWHIPYHRIAYWNRFERPATVPLYYHPKDWLLSWWIKE